MHTLTRRLTLKLLIPAIAATSWMIAPAVAADAKTVNLALDWTPNTNHVGLYVAEAKGYFKDADLTVNILPYTDTGAATLVSNGLADFGIAGVGFYSQRAAGADIKGVYAVVQSDTGRLVTEADRTDIKSPKDLDGKTYGGFGSAWENALVGSIIKGDGGKGDFKTVTLGTSAYEALGNKTVDFTLEILTWEGVQAELAGEKLNTFKYTDYGIPDQYTTLIVSSEKYLKANPDNAKAFLAAVQKGYAYSVDHPDEAAKILIAANPDVLTDPKLVDASMKMLVDGHFLRSADGVIGTFEPKKASGIGEYLFKSGLLVDENGKVLTEKPDFASYITNDYLPGK